MIDDRRLLDRYVREGSQAAFSQLVSRHLNFVYAICRREVGDASLAEDVTQTVFLLLAKKAHGLRAHTSLSGWLFQTARFAAKNARREALRRMREQRMEEHMLTTGHDDHAIWDQIEPHLNDALASLNANDQKTILLRFADGLSFPELSSALKVSEDAARMRLNRAVDKMRRFLAKEGVTLSAVALIGLLVERTTEAAPAACAAAVNKIAGSVAAGNTAFINPNVHSQVRGALKTMTMTKLKSAAILGVGIAVAGTIPFVARAQKPAGAAPQATPTIVEAPAPVARTVAEKQSPTDEASLASLEKLKLSRPFTLTYTALVKDVTTPEMRATTMKWQKKNADYNVSAGNITRTDADDTMKYAAEHMGVHQPDSTFKVTISSDGNKLLFQKIDPDNTLTVIYDGGKTYNYETATHRMEVNSGLRSGQMFDLPLPGVAIPHLPLIQSDTASSTPEGSSAMGKVLDINCDTEGGQYSRGKITLAGQNVSAMKILYQQDFPISGWDFFDHRSFEGIQIASTMRYTLYSARQFVPINTPHQEPWHPMRTIDYKLVSASDAPLDANQFDPNNLVSQGDQVQQNSDQGVKAYTQGPGSDTKL